MVFDLDRERIVGIGASSPWPHHRTPSMAGSAGASRRANQGVKRRRKTHLGENSVSWLVNRHPSMRLSRRLLLWYVAIAWLVYTCYLTRCWRLGERGARAWSSSVSFCHGWGLSGSGSISRVTPASLSEAKECGALEQILVTPLDENNSGADISVRWPVFGSYPSWCCSPP